MSTEIAHHEADVLPATALAPRAATPGRDRDAQLADLRSEAEFLKVAYGLAEEACKTSLVAAHFRNKPADAAIAIAFGSTLDWHWTKSVQDVYVVNGKPSIQSKEMRELLIRAGHTIWEEEVGPTKVILAGTRRGSDVVVRVEWTIDKAKQAGLLSNANYAKFPENMLYARCTTDLAKRLAPDALSGLGIVEEQEDITASARYIRNEASAPKGVAGLRQRFLEPAADEPKADPEPVANITGGVEAITDAQIRKLNMLLTEVEKFPNTKEGGAQKSEWLRGNLKRDSIKSPKDVTKDEASELIVFLEEAQRTDAAKAAAANTTTQEG